LEVQRVVTLPKLQQHFLKVRGREYVVEVRAGRKIASFPSARNYGRTQIMKKSIKVKPKRGRPPSGGRDPLMGFRASPVLRASIVKWAEYHPDKPSLSEAVRRLVELGLKAKK
jgi:hypothetical protein